MTIYIISNARQLTKKIIKSLNIAVDDTIVLFNGMYPYNFIRDIGVKKIISVQRPRTCTYMITNELKAGVIKINDFLVFDRADRRANTKIDDEFIKLVKLKVPNSTINEVVGCWDVFIEKFNFNKSPTSGMIALIYFDYYYPDEDKVLVGFTSNKSRPDSIMPRHDYDKQREIMLNYCINKNISFRYCVLDKNKLKDVDPYEYYNINKDNKDNEINRFKIEKEIINYL